MIEDIGGIATILLFFVFVYLEIPVAFALLLSSIAGLLYTSGFTQTVGITGGVFTQTIASYDMTVIPAFVLMGNIAFVSGVFDEAFDAIQIWFERLPGGLLVGTVAANAVFGAMSGSMVAACTVIGRVAIPKMLKAGYEPYKAAGCVAVAGTLAALIPPSILICIYGLLVSQSIGKVLMAGFVPGIISALSYMAYILFSNRKEARLKTKHTLREKFLSVRYLWIVIMLLLAVLGSMVFGIATPTEAGSLGAVAMFLLALVKRKMDWSKLVAAIIDTVRISGIVFILIGAANLFGRVLVISNFTMVLTQSLLSISDNRYVIFFLVSVIWLIIGTVVEALPMLVITLPIMYPLMMHLGFDPIWFGIISVKFCNIAEISPPVGMTIFATHMVAPEIPVKEIYKGAIRYLWMDAVTIILFTIFPEIVTFLPNLMI
jgi:tripartite ATP-independent transporter DctM subunit